MTEAKEIQCSRQGSQTREVTGQTERSDQGGRRYHRGQPSGLGSNSEI